MVNVENAYRRRPAQRDPPDYTVSNRSTANPYAAATAGNQTFMGVSDMSISHSWHTARSTASDQA
jgi:hypothetical protein